MITIEHFTVRKITYSMFAILSIVLLLSELTRMLCRRLIIVLIIW